AWLRTPKSKRRTIGDKAAKIQAGRTRRGTSSATSSMACAGSTEHPTVYRAARPPQDRRAPEGTRDLSPRSAIGTRLTSGTRHAQSAQRPRADHRGRGLKVRVVPGTDVRLISPADRSFLRRI